MLSTVFASTVAKVAAVGLSVFMTGGALASTGHLPDDAQDAVAKTAAYIGLDLPAGDDQVEDEGTEVEDATEDDQVEDEGTEVEDATEDDQGEDEGTEVEDTYDDDDTDSDFSSATGSNVVDADAEVGFASVHVGIDIGL